MSLFRGYFHNTQPAFNGLFHLCKNTLGFCTSISLSLSNIGFDKSSILINVSPCIKHYQSHNHVQNVYIKLLSIKQNKRTL